MDAQAMNAEFAALVARLDQIEDVTDPKRIAVTAEELRRVGYTPMLLVEPAGFLEASLAQIEMEVARIRTLPVDELPNGMAEPDEVRLQAAMLLVSNYEVLVQLRIPDPKAWDDVIELYGED